jgi:alanine racemase
MNINANILINNITTIQSLKPNDDIFCVVKANAYGHGLEEIVQILDTTNCAMIVVDNLPEYQRAKRFTSKPILMIGATHPLNYRHLRSKQAIFGVISLPILETLAQLRRPVRVHLFINTGMNRE